jgi:hypothetical protein
MLGISRLFFVAAISSCIIFSGATAQAEQEESKLRIYPGFGVQRHSEGWTPRGHLVGRYRFHQRWFVDIVGSTGAVLNNLDGGDQFFVSLAAGPGFSTGENPAGWELRISPRFTHVHHATFSSWADTPGSNIAGDSNGGVHHRTGAQLALGVAGPDLNIFQTLAICWGTEVLADYLPNSSEMAMGAGLMVNFSLRRR